VNTTRPANYTIALGGLTFDPLQPAGLPAIHPELQADELNNDVYIVQFVTQSLEPYTAQMKSGGADVHSYVSNYSFITQMDRATVAFVRDLPYVRWVGPYHPAYKLDPVVRNAEFPAGYEQVMQAGDSEADHTSAENVIATGWSTGNPDEARAFNIMVHERGPRMKEIVKAHIEASGGRVMQMIPDGFRLVAELTRPQLRDVLHLNEVWVVDPWGPPELDMNLVRIDGGADFLEDTLGLTGDLVTGEVMDQNVRATHVDFQSDPIIFHGPRNGSDLHGTAVMGIAFGDGTGNPLGRGLLPDGQPVFADFEFLTNRYAHTEELVDPDGYRCVFQTNSWGSPRGPQYTTISAEMDDIIFGTDLVITNSLSNSGAQEGRPEAWAKNIVAVGGVNHNNTLTTADDCWCGGSSIGPATDGRIKPDLWYFYDSVFAPAGGSDTGYGEFGGTSAATPSVVGYFGLMFNMWHQGVFPGFGGGQDAFETRPHMSTARALMFQSANQYDFDGPNHDKSRYHQGWGRPNVENLYNLSGKILIIDETDLLQNLDVNTYEVEVPVDEPAFRATLVYADPMGVPLSTVHRINDLSLRVSSPNGRVYWGNSGLHDGPWSRPGDDEDHINIAENVFIQSPTPGAWTVEVIATEINQDSHLETPEIDADYGLVISGIQAPDRLLLEMSELFQGELATATITNATPNELVYLAFSLTGPGQRTVPFLNVTLNLDRPRELGRKKANANGVVEFVQLLGNPGKLDVWFQAVEFGRISNVVKRTLQ
jgi:serine protease AprX